MNTALLILSAFICICFGGSEGYGGNNYYNIGQGQNRNDYNVVKGAQNNLDYGLAHKNLAFKRANNHQNFAKNLKYANQHFKDNTFMNKNNHNNHINQAHKYGNNIAFAKAYHNNDKRFKNAKYANQGKNIHGMQYNNVHQANIHKKNMGNLNAKNAALNSEFDNSLDNDKGVSYGDTYYQKGSYGSAGGAANYAKRNGAENHQFANMKNQNFLNDYGKNLYNKNSGKAFSDLEHNRMYGLNSGIQNNNGANINFANNKMAYKKMSADSNANHENYGRYRHGNSNMGSENILYNNNQNFDKGVNQGNLVRVKRNQDYHKSADNFVNNYMRHKNLGNGYY